MAGTTNPCARGRGRRVAWESPPDRAAPDPGRGSAGGPGWRPPPCCTLPTATSFSAGSAHGGPRSRRVAHLLAEALDLGLRELLALIQLLDPLVQFLGEHLLVHDATRPNRLPLRATPAPPPAHGPHAHAVAGSRGIGVVTGGCSALAPARWLSPQCSAAGRCLPQLAIAPELGSL